MSYDMMMPFHPVFSFPMMPLRVCLCLLSLHLCHIYIYGYDSMCVCVLFSSNYVWCYVTQFTHSILVLQPEFYRESGIAAVENEYTYKRFWI